MPALRQEQILQEARELYQAEKTKRVLRPFTEKYSGITPEDSYRIQLALIEMKKADGAKVVGKKIGLTSKAMQKMLNVDQPDYGHILDNMVLQDAAAFRIENTVIEGTAGRARDFDHACGFQRHDDLVPLSDCACLIVPSMCNPLGNAERCTGLGR